jgi:hypothetical protein
MRCRKKVSDALSVRNSVTTMTEDACMEIPGRVRNGVVVLEGDLRLPEGTLVTVSCLGAPQAGSPRSRRAVQFPLVRSDRPGSRRLTAERLADLLEDDDIGRCHSERGPVEARGRDAGP